MPMLLTSRIYELPFLLMAVMLVAISLQAAAVEPPSPQCMERWSFSGIYPGMRKSEFQAVFPDAERLKRPWREKTYRVLVENPIVGINTGAGEMTVFLDKKRVSAIRFALQSASHLDELLQQLEREWGQPFEGMADGATLILPDELKGEKTSEQVDTGFVGTQTLSWPNDCGIDVSLYLDDPPYFWVVED